MTPPTNLHALIAAGGWGNLSHAFLSAKAKAQLRDSHGRFIKMNSLVRWKDQDGEYRWGKVVGLAPDGGEVSVQEDGKSAVAKIKPKQLEVVKALIPDKPGDAPTPKAYAPDDKTDLPTSEPLYVDTKGFKKVGSQAGSNSGGFYEGPDGTQYYVKKAQTEQHAANEVLAARLYKKAGVGAPDVYLTDMDGEPAVASKVVPDLSPLFPGGKTSKAALTEGRKGFAMDAWLGNWDSVGLVYDNLMKDKDGHAVRVDTGGALLYRAQGAPKGGLFGDKVGETDSLRDSSTNPQAAKIFGGMSDQDIAQDVLSTVDKVSNEDVDALIDDLPFSSDSVKDQLKKTLLARKNDLNAKFGITQPDAESDTAPQIPDAAPDKPIVSDPAVQQDELNADEINSIKKYTQNAYGPINAHLRTGALSDNPKYQPDAIEEHVKHLDSAMAKSVSTKDAVLYRGAKGQLFDDVEVGSVIEDKGYVSTSASAELSEHAFSEGGTLFTINAPAGSHMLDVDKTGSAVSMGEDTEEEFILPRGTKLKVTGVSTDAAGLKHVTADLLPADEAAPEPAPELKGQPIGKFGPDGVSYTPTAAGNVKNGDIFKRTSSSGKESWFRVDLPYDKYTATITATELRDKDALGGPKPEKIVVSKTSLLQVADGVPNQVAHLVPGAKKAEPAAPEAPAAPSVPDGYVPVVDPMSLGYKDVVQTKSGKTVQIEDSIPWGPAGGGAVKTSYKDVDSGFKGSHITPKGGDGFFLKKADTSGGNDDSTDSGADKLGEDDAAGGAQGAPDLAVGPGDGDSAPEVAPLPEKGAHVPGTKVTSNKDGFSGVVVKHNAKDGYSLVQSHDGSKKLWRKTDSLQVIEDAPAPATPSKPGAAPKAGHDADAVNAAISKLGNVLPGAGEEVPGSVDETLTAMFNGSSNQTDVDNASAWFDTYSADLPQEQSDAVWDAWQKVVDAAGFDIDGHHTPPETLAAESQTVHPDPTPHADAVNSLIEAMSEAGQTDLKPSELEPDASEDELKQALLDLQQYQLESYSEPSDAVNSAMQKLADQLGVDLPGADNPPSSAAVPVDSLDIGDVVNLGGLELTIKKLTHQEDGSINAIVSLNGGGTTVLNFEPSSTIALVKKTDTPDPSKDLPTTTTAGLNPGDKVLFHGQNMTVQKIAQNPTFESLADVTFKLDNGKETTGAFGPAAPWKLVSKADASETPDSGSDPASSIAEGDWVMHGGKPQKVVSAIHAQSGVSYIAVQKDNGEVESLPTMPSDAKVQKVNAPGAADQSPETPGDAPDAAVPTGTLVPGSDHVYQDAQGEYVTTSAGHVLRVGDTVKSTKDGLVGTIVQLEKKAPYIKVKGADGKIKGRQMNTLLPNKEEKPDAPEAPAAPEADAPAAPDEPSLKAGDKVTGKTNQLKPGMVVQTYGNSQYKVDDVTPGNGGDVLTHVDLTNVKTGLEHKDFPVVNDSTWEIVSVPNGDAPEADALPNGEPELKVDDPVTPAKLVPGMTIKTEMGSKYTVNSVNKLDNGNISLNLTNAETGSNHPSHTVPGDMEGWFVDSLPGDDESNAAPDTSHVSHAVALKDLKVGDQITDSDGDHGHVVSIKPTNDGQDLQIEYVLPDAYGNVSFFKESDPDDDTYFTKEPGDPVDVPSAEPEPAPEPVIGPKSVKDFQPGDVAHIGSGKYTIVSNEKAAGNKYNVTYTDPDGQTYTLSLPGSDSAAFGNKIESAGAAAETPAAPESDAPSGTLVPGSDHVYKDAQGKYVVNKHGYVLREGMQVTSLKDGHTGTITFLETKAKYAKVQGPDGTKKGRQIDTLKPSDANAKKVDQPTPGATPSAPSSVKPTDQTKSYMQAGVKKPPQFKVGDVIGKDKKTVEYQKSSTKVTGKHEVKFAEDAEPLTVSKNNEWEHWQETLPGANGKKTASELQPGDVIGEDENSKKKVKSVTEWADTPGHVDVLFDGDTEWSSIPQDKSFYSWPKGTSTDNAPKAEPEAAGPVQLSHDPIDFTTPDGMTVSVPAGATVYKGFYWSGDKPVMVDGFNNGFKLDATTGEVAPVSIPYYYIETLTPDAELFSNPNVADVTPDLGSALTPDEHAKVISKIDEYAEDHKDDLYAKGSVNRLNALKKLLNDPSGDTMDEQDWDYAVYGMGMSSYLDMPAGSKSWTKLNNEFVKLQKLHTGGYKNEWATHNSGQFHYDANERKALASIGLSDNAMAFIQTKNTAPTFNTSAAAEIHAKVTNAAHATVIDDLFGHGTSASIAKKTRGPGFRSGLSGNNSPYAPAAGDLPSTGGKNGTVLYLGDQVIASDGQGGQVTLVTLDGKVRVRRADGTSFTRKGTQFVVTSSPVTTGKPSASQTGEAKAYTAKPRPEFSLPDWTKGNIGKSASIPDVLEKIKSSNEAGNVGWSFAADGDQIEDMDVHVARVLSSSGQELIELKFKLTPKQGNAMFKRHSADPKWGDTNIKIEGRQVTDYSKLAQLTGHLTYESHGGRTLSLNKEDGSSIRFHRANGKSMDKSGNNPVAFHNMVQIRLPADATPSDIAKAMYDAGVDSPGPATVEGVKRLGENRLLSLFAKKTDAWTGNDAIQNRQALLAQVEKEWGISANDLLIAHGANGRFEIRMPESMADKLIAKTGVRYFTHSLHGGTNSLKQVGSNPFSALLSTSIRRTEGVKAEGSSSTADIHTGGADYMFTRLKQTMGPMLSSQVVFDARRLFQRMDWFSQTYDSWGKHSSNMDIIGNTSPSATEAMFKHRLDLDDAIGYLVSSEDERQSIIKMLKNSGITNFGSRTVDEFVILAPKTNVTAPTPAVETVPISSLEGASV